MSVVVPLDYLVDDANIRASRLPLVTLLSPKQRMPSWTKD
jgi:hypothetical protein